MDKNKPPNKPPNDPKNSGPGSNAKDNSRDGKTKRLEELEAKVQQLLTSSNLQHTNVQQASDAARQAQIEVNTLRQENKRLQQQLQQLSATTSQLATDIQAANNTAQQAHEECQKLRQENATLRTQLKSSQEASQKKKEESTKKMEEMVKKLDEVMNVVSSLQVPRTPTSSHGVHAQTGRSLVSKTLKQALNEIATPLNGSSSNRQAAARDRDDRIQGFFTNSHTSSHGQNPSAQRYDSASSSRMSKKDLGSIASKKGNKEEDTDEEKTCSMCKKLVAQTNHHVRSYHATNDKFHCLKLDCNKTGNVHQLIDHLQRHHEWTHDDADREMFYEIQRICFPRRRQLTASRPIRRTPSRAGTPSRPLRSSTPSGRAGLSRARAQAANESDDDDDSMGGLLNPDLGAAQSQTHQRAGLESEDDGEPINDSRVREHPPASEQLQNLTSTALATVPDEELNPLAVQQLLLKLSLDELEAHPIYKKLKHDNPEAAQVLYELKQEERQQQVQTVQQQGPQEIAVTEVIPAHTVLNQVVQDVDDDTMHFSDEDDDSQQNRDEDDPDTRRKPSMIIWNGLNGGAPSQESNFTSQEKSRSPSRREEEETHREPGNMHNTPLVVHAIAADVPQRPKAQQKERQPRKQLYSSSSESSDEPYQANKRNAEMPPVDSTFDRSTEFPTFEGQEDDGDALVRGVREESETIQDDQNRQPGASNDLYGPSDNLDQQNRLSRHEQKRNKRAETLNKALEYIDQMKRRGTMNKDEEDPQESPSQRQESKRPNQDPREVQIRNPFEASPMRNSPISERYEESQRLRGLSPSSAQSSASSSLAERQTRVFQKGKEIYRPSPTKQPSREEIERALSKKFVEECVNYRYQGRCSFQHGCKFTHGTDMTFGLQEAVKILRGERKPRKPLQVSSIRKRETLPSNYRRRSVSRPRGVTPSDRRKPRSRSPVRQRSRSPPRGPSDRSRSSSPPRKRDKRRRSPSSSISPIRKRRSTPRSYERRGYTKSRSRSTSGERRKRREARRKRASSSSSRERSISVVSERSESRAEMLEDQEDSIQSPTVDTTDQMLTQNDHPTTLHASNLAATHSSLLHANPILANLTIPSKSRMTWLDAANATLPESDEPPAASTQNSSNRTETSSLFPNVDAHNPSTPVRLSTSATAQSPTEPSPQATPNQSHAHPTSQAIPTLQTESYAEVMNMINSCGDGKKSKKKKKKREKNESEKEKSSTKSTKEKSSSSKPPNKDALKDDPSYIVSLVRKAGLLLCYYHISNTCAYKERCYKVHWKRGIGFDDSIGTNKLQWIIREKLF